MTDVAFQFYTEAETEQHSRNEARRIRTRVDQARKSPHAAGIRWPFELLQNALDAGPRDGRSTVTVGLQDDGTTMLFQHDGAPFALNELAALVSGGSSKDYESETTTGRFGTGFLVTHVLAERVRLRGLLALESGCEAFDLTLDRAGDEEAILANMQNSRDAIRAAVAVADPETMQSATIEYEYGGNDVFVRGLDELSRALPYIYGTRRTLGRFDLRTGEDRVESWCPSDVNETVIEGGLLESRRIAVMTDGVPTRDLWIHRFTTERQTAAAALVLVEETSNGPEVRLPDTKAPRVFREYPLRSSGFVPVNLIIDGKFDPEQERGGLLMNDRDKDLLEEALVAGVAAVRYAIEQAWRNAHLLARATRPEMGFEAGNAEETQWWTDTLRAFAQRLAGTPIVECESGMLPAFVEDGKHANFVVPRLREAPTEAETSVERLWPLVAAAKRLVPPKRKLTADWIAIVEGWHTLAATVELIWITKLAECVRVLYPA
ncbi:MAG: hypothetical protein OXH52_18925 [Gammaproteobacteria bacterium]|nr:hypothetical protein [Gammaproteobacteria bacterium]